MSKIQTDKSRYPSLYSPSQYITAAQYILELLCEKKAEFEGTRLPIKFWQFPKWSKFFRRNLRQTHKLLKQYDESAIINAVKSPKFKNRYSIFTPYFLSLVEKEQVTLNKQTVELSDNYSTKRVKQTSQIRQQFVQPNLIDKLDD